MAWVLKSESTGLGDVLVEGGMCFSKVTGGGEDLCFLLYHLLISQSSLIKERINNLAAMPFQASREQLYNSSSL